MIFLSTQGNRKMTIPDMNRKIARLKAFYAREKRTPGYNEMLDIFEYKTKSSVFSLLLKLDREGYVKKKGRKIALTEKITGSIKLLGTVQAGFPSPAEEELIDTMNLDEFLVQKPEATFMLKVTGDSMTDAGICPGDMVLVERGRKPKNNDVVIAQVDGEWTIKFFVNDKNGMRLEPANNKYKPIYPKNTLELAGVVTSVIRKYK